MCLRGGAQNGGRRRLLVRVAFFNLCVASNSRFFQSKSVAVLVALVAVVGDAERGDGVFCDCRAVIKRIKITKKKQNKKKHTHTVLFFCSSFAQTKNARARASAVTFAATNKQTNLHTHTVIQQLLSRSLL